MRPKPSKPAFQSVVDLGLRDTGVRNDPRKLAAHFGKMSLPVLGLGLGSVLAVCLIVGWLGASVWIVAALALVWTAGVFALALRMGKRAPVVVVKVTAEGNKASWLLVAPYLLLLALAAAASEPVLVIALGVFAGAMTLLVWRGRKRLPEVLRELRPLLGAGEPVLGDGIGLAPGARGARGWDEVFRLIVATDRRVLVAGSTRSAGRFLLHDVPYGRVSRFGIEWKYWGRAGVLSLTVAGVEGAPPEELVISSIVPANLVSIARALRSHGVPADDPAAVAEAERGWEEARHPAPRQRVLDRGAMSTREFDRGLWLLLGLSAIAFYVNPFGVGLGASRDAAVLVLLVVPVVSGVCGYVSGTKSSLTYIVPLNLLVIPAFFFAAAADVVALMIVMSALAAIGLWAGSALRRAVGSAGLAPARVAARPERRVARGSLREVVSGRRLIRISAVVLATVVALAATAAAAGFELITLRLAIDELTGKQLPVDGRSNLNGNAASFSYTPGRDLREFITDEHWDAGPNDGARWELRSSFTKGYNVVSLSHYIFEPHLDDREAVADFLAGKEREHSKLARSDVTHTERVVGGRRGYVWDHDTPRGEWHYTVWFPQPNHSVRVECIARREKEQFERLCAEALESLEFH